MKNTLLMDNQHAITDWLPTTAKEVELQGWEELDVILFSGDAYVDHPSFGAAVIGRIIESQGLRVAENDCRFCPLVAEGRQRRDIG